MQNCGKFSDNVVIICKFDMKSTALVNISKFLAKFIRKKNQNQPYLVYI